MNITRLNYFVAVAESGSFSEAAELLFTTQSAVSKQILALERELSVNLFDRSRRKISLTEQGLVVLKYAQQMIDGHAAMLHELSGFGLNETGTLTIASIPVMAHYKIPAIIAKFRMMYPNIKMVLDEREGSDIIPAMEQRQYEMAFMRGDGIAPDTFEQLDIFTDKIVAIFPTNHPLAKQPHIPLAQLKNEKFLLLNKSTMLYQRCVEACREAGFAPNIIYTGTRSENIMEMVASGMGISLIMRQTAEYIKAKDVELVPISESISSVMSLVRIRRGRYTTAAKAFWSFVENGVRPVADV